MLPKDLEAYVSLQYKCDQANTKLVLPETMSHRRLCIVGESLGADEELNDAYFCGRAGTLLHKLISETGLVKDIIHITNLVKVRPPNNDMTLLPKLGLSIDDFIPYLVEELTTINPSCILAVGRYALEALCQLTGINKWRGSVLSEKLTGREYLTVPTLHPAYLLRGQMHLYPYVRNDVKRFGEYGMGIAPVTVPFTLHTNPSLTQVIEYLHTVSTAATETCIDIETIAASHITCVGISNGPNEAMCIPFRHQGIRNRWTEAEFILILHALRQVFATPHLVKIGQNIHYDLHFLQPLCGFPREPVADTMYMHQLIHPDAPHDLGFIMTTFTDMPYHKDEFKDWRSKDIPRDEILWDYNCKDVIGTHRAYNKLKLELEQRGLYEFFTGFTMPVRRVLFEMEHTGILFDTEAANEWKRFILDEELPIALDIIKKQTGCDINPNSSQSIAKFLAKVGVKFRYSEKGNPLLDEQELGVLIARHPQYAPILKMILCARTLKAKDAGTYLSAGIGADNRMHTSYGITVTGRLTSHKNHKGLGTNVQNVPEHFRALFKPEPGHIFLDPDLSQAEARWMAWLMDSPKLKAIFKAGKKIHKIMGGEIFGKDPEALTPGEYLIAKKTVHGSNYSLGLYKFAVIIERPVAYARQIQEKYRTIVPELCAYHREIQETILNTRRLVTPYGRVRIFTGRLDDETFRSGYAQIPQSGVVDTLNLGMLGLWIVKPSDVHIKAQVHDSILISLPEARVSLVERLVKHHLEILREVIINNEPLTVPVDVGKPRHSWYKKGD